jgi:hypothetical protein
MPFDDLKTLPEGLAVTPTMQPVAWAVEYDGETITLHNSFAKAKDYAKFTRQDGIEGRVVPLYRSPPFVAVRAEQQHDAPTCCAERQEPDVGEGWRWVEPGEILQAGDEVDVGVNCRQWVPTQRGGVRIGDEEDSYRRRVTPDAQQIEITPAAASAMCERNARDALLERIENLRAENHEQQKKILQACLENERLRSEVERMRLLPKEVRFLLGIKNFDGHLVNDLLKRQGGGE